MTISVTGPLNAAPEPEDEHEQPGEPAPEPEAEQEQPDEPAPEFLVPRTPSNTSVSPAQHQEAVRRVSF